MTAGRLAVMETERLRLVPMSREDHADYAALLADPAFWPAIFAKPPDPEEVWLRLLRDIGHWRALGHGSWSLRLKTDGRYAGTVGLLDYRRDVVPALDALEMGWGLSPALQGQGLAREAAQAAIDFAETELDARRLVCMIAPGNAPSLALARHLGFSPYADTTYKQAPIVLLERDTLRTRPRGT